MACRYGGFVEVPSTLTHPLLTGGVDGVGGTGLGGAGWLVGCLAGAEAPPLVTFTGETTIVMRRPSIEGKRSILMVSPSSSTMPLKML